MVELALRALFESASSVVSTTWHSFQKNSAENQPPTEENEFYIKGCFFVWQNILQRLCDGCLGKDSDSIFCQWLTAYRKHLFNASNSDSVESSSYMRGQVDAFNSFVRIYAMTSKKINPAYKKKIEDINSKQKELDSLRSELDNLLWSNDLRDESHEMSSM